MTYCLGWKDVNNVYLLADSAISFSSKYIAELRVNKAEYSSFGEKHTEYSNLFVEEGVLKIRIFNNEIGVIFSGNTDEIADVIVMMQTLLENGSTMRETLECIRRSVSYDAAKFVIGFMEEGKPILIYFDTKQIVEGDVFHIGSGSKKHDWVKRVQWFVTQCKAQNLAPEDKLFFLMTVLQCYSTTDRMMSIGVGGVFCGVLINSGGIKWAKDVTYFIYYTRDLCKFDLVTVIARNNCICVSSSFNNGTTVILPSKKIIDSTDYHEKFIPEIKKILSDSKTDFFVFYSPLSPISYMILLVRINKKLHNNLFRMWKRDKNNETKYAFGLTPLLFNALRGKGITAEADSLPFLGCVSAEEVEYMERKEFILSQGLENVVDDFDEDYQ